MQTVNFLAEVWGFSLVIIGLSLLLKPQRVKQLFHVLEDSKNLVVSGVVDIIVGIALVLTYNVWDQTWKVIVTLLGWLMLVKGLALLLFTEKVEKMINKVKSNDNIILVKLVGCVIIGCLLIYLGFTM